MKMVIIGGTGLIGTKVAGHLREQGHTVVAASPSTGVNAVTGEGLSEVLQGTDIVIDLSNSPSFEEGPVLNFFETSGRNLMAAELQAGVKHHVALSIVGVDRMLDLGYMRAKKVQEDLIKGSGIPYTIIRSTQFMEFIPALAAAATQGNEIHGSHVEFQPIAAEDVALLVTHFALASAENLTPDIAGPERRPLSEFFKAFVEAKATGQQVVPNQRDEYFGGSIPHDGLVPQGEVTLGKINMSTWLAESK
jgi:uncharacterized protein YbjT (DUF2867 family)